MGDFLLGGAVDIVFLGNLGQARSDLATGEIIQKE